MYVVLLISQKDYVPIRFFFVYLLDNRLRRLNGEGQLCVLRHSRSQSELCRELPPSTNRPIILGCFLS